MSEPKQEYKIDLSDDTVWTGVVHQPLPRVVIPQGEICLQYDEPEIDTEAEKVTDDELDVEFLLCKIEGWVREFNIAIDEIKPFISQKQKTRAGMHGLKTVYPCCTKFYKALSGMQKTLYNVRKELENEI